MDPERHKRISELFIQACDVPEAQRDAFLDEACGDDDALREAVEALLAHDAGAEAEFRREKEAQAQSGGDEARTSAAAPALRLAPEDKPPERIGPYRLLEPLGAGGMGVVYLAEQTAPVRRRVALKVIRAGFGSREVVARFEAERQALALMDHPNIAQVYDAGATDDGRPYFVMEHVPGAPITDHCNRHRLTLRERLALFLQVCDAVQHAHQKGVVHRDLKPTNVLVMFRDNDSVVKVIDFGVAKAIERPLIERTLFTELGQLIGTPEYMSPEQAEMTSQDVDTRSDVYSLGVLLYELVTGTLPFEPETLRAAGFAEIQRIIREVDPPKPSTRLSGVSRAKGAPTTKKKSTIAEPGTLLRQVRGDLDWITMRALEKDRSRRYSTVAEFAEDIRRHLRNEPVAAGPPSAVYRARKFVRRHRAGVAATSLTAAAVMIAAAIAIASAVDAVRARDFARARDEAGRELSRSVLGPVHQAIANLAGATEARSLLIDAAAKYLRSLEAQAENNPALLGEIARGYERLAQVEAGDLAGSVGDTAAAVEHAQAALDLRQRAASRSPSDAAASRALASAHELLGRLLQRARSASEAQAHYDQALDVRRTLAQAHPADVDAQRDLASSLMRQGDLAKRRGEYAQARRLFEEALARTERAASLDGDESRVATLLLRLGNLATDMGDPAESRRRFEAALQIRAAIAQAHPDDSRAQRDLMWAHYFAADPAFNAGDAEQAMQHLRAAQSIAQRRYDADANNAQALSDLLLVQERLGDALLHVEGDAAGAVEAYRRIVALAEPAAARDPKDAQRAEYLAQSLERLATAQREAGDASDAVVSYRSALSVVDPIAQRDPTNHNRRFLRASLLAGLGAALDAQGRSAEAVDRLHEAAAEFEAIGAGETDDVYWRYGFADALRILAAAAQRVGAAADARSAAARALAILPPPGQDDDADRLREQIERLLAQPAGPS